PMQMKPLGKRVVWTKAKSWISSGLAIIAIFLLLIGMKENAPVSSLIGTAVLTILLIYILPYLFRWFIHVSLPYSRSMFGETLYLALQRLLPQVRKNMSTILLILSIFVILIFSTATMYSIAISNEQYINEKFETE